MLWISPLLLFSLLADIPPVIVNPCQPSPCGSNALCQVINDSPSCSCLPEFIGSPPNCRPECVSNSECPSHQACINQKCKDPCPGSCGNNAECRTVSHTPMCVCAIGYTGDPFTQCFTRPSKIFLKDISIWMITYYHNLLLKNVYNNRKFMS